MRKKTKKWQLENLEMSEISEILEKLLRVFFFPSFQFCATAKIENSDLKILEKNSWGSPRFLRFPSFRPGQLNLRSSHWNSLKKGVLRNLQISQENTCIKILNSWEILKIFKNT